MRSPLRFQTVVRLIDTYGRQWVLSGIPASKQKGVTLLPDAAGLADMDFEVLTAQSARSRGDIFVSKTMPPRTLSLPLFLDGDGSAVRLSAIRKELYHSLTAGPVRLCLWTPTKGDRWITGTVTNIADQSSNDVYAKNQVQTLDVEITGHDPLWHGYPARSKITAPTASSNTWRSFWDAPFVDKASYPKIALTTVSASTHEIRLPSKDSRSLRTVRLPPMRARESFWIDTDPTARPIYSDQRGSIPWRVPQSRAIPMSVNDGHSGADISLRSTVANRSFTAVLFVPTMHDMGY